MANGRTIDLISADDLGVDDVVEVVTGIFQIEGALSGNDEMRILCPVHDDRDPSCDVNIETGFWNCFSCGAGSDLVGLGCRVLKKDRDEIIHILRPVEPSAIAAAIHARLKKQKKIVKGKNKKTFKPSIPQLGSYSPLKGQPLHELKARGFKRKTLEQWGVRFVDSAVLMKDPDSVKDDGKESFEITNAVGIPILGMKGEPIAWCLSGDTLVATPEGELPIKEVQAGQTVWSWDEANQRQVPEVVAWSGYSGTKRTLKIALANGRELVCTPDHEVLTDAGWKQARNIHCGESLVGLLMSNLRVPDLEEAVPEEDGVLPEVPAARNPRWKIRGQERLSRVRQRDQLPIDVVPSLLLRRRASSSEQTARNLSGRAASQNGEGRPASVRVEVRRVCRRFADRLWREVQGSGSDRSLHHRLHGAEAQVGDRGLWRLLAQDPCRPEASQEAQEDGQGSWVPTDRSVGLRASSVGAEDRLSVAVVGIEEGDCIDVYDLTIPTHHNFIAEGVVVHNCYRATEDSEPWFQTTRYLYTPGVKDTLNRTWFGLYEHRKEKAIVVVEGALDAIWCAQNGFPAVAMLGTNSQQFAKVDALTRYRNVTILGDRDGPGELAVIRLGVELTSLGTPVTIALYHKWMRNRRGKRASDPQELCPVDLDLILTTAEPWAIWSRSEDVRSLVRAVGQQKGKKSVVKGPVAR